MGMYTELVIKAKLKKNLPEDVKFILNFLFNKESDIDIWDENMKIKANIKFPDHDFFKKDRWTFIGRCNSHYHIPACLSIFDGSYLFSRSDFKNYDGEIDSFIDWISPYIEAEQDQCIGWKWYEEDRQPTLLYSR